MDFRQGGERESSPTPQASSTQQTGLDWPREPLISNEGPMRKYCSSCVESNMTAGCGNSDRGPRCHVSAVPRARRRRRRRRRPTSLLLPQSSPCAWPKLPGLSTQRSMGNSLSNSLSLRSRTNRDFPLGPAGRGSGIAHRAICQAMLHVGSASQRGESLALPFSMWGNSSSTGCSHQDKHRSSSQGRPRLGRICSSRLQANDLQGRFWRRGKAR